MKPVRAPDAVKSPAEILQYLLTQSVPLASPQSAVVGSSIALNGQDITSRLVGITNRKVNAKSCGAHLGVNRVA